MKANGQDIGEQPLTAEQSDSPSVTFEHAFRRLEELVANLEDGGLSLEEMVQNFAEGMVLVKQCYAKLDNAQLRVTTLLGEIEAEQSNLFGEQFSLDEDAPTTDC